MLQLYLSRNISTITVIFNVNDFLIFSVFIVYIHLYSFYLVSSFLLVFVLPSRWGLEYVDCILYQGVRFLSTRGVLRMRLNRNLWGRFRSGNLGSVEYPFITITTRFTLTRSGCNCWGPTIVFTNPYTRAECDARLNFKEFNSFPSPRPIALPSLKSSACLILSHSWKGE